MSIERPNIFESKESPKNAIVPIYCFDKPGFPISGSVIDEVQRASLETYKVVANTIKPYQKGIRFTDIVSVQPSPKNLLQTEFVRKPNTDPQVLAIVLSTFPLYDLQGRELIAYYRADNIALLNIPILHQQLSPTSQPIAAEISAAVAVIEETIHHIQHEYFHQPFDGTLSTFDDIDQHLQHPAEKEAAKFKKRVLKHLYPNLDLRIKGVDY